jgi:DNA-binding MarR family transcriptional regulator
MSSARATTADPSALWRDLSARHARVQLALDKALQTEHGLSPTEFDVLERLAIQAEEVVHGCRMQELSDAVSLSQSALSRLVGRLEAEGLVERGICADDRRGIYAGITDAGRERFDAARPTQRRVLSELLGDD